MLDITLTQLIFNAKVAYKIVKFVTNLRNVSVVSLDLNLTQQLPHVSFVQFLTTIALNALQVNAPNADKLFIWIQQRETHVKGVFQQSPTAFNVRMFRHVCNALQVIFQQVRRELLHVVLAQ